MPGRCWEDAGKAGEILGRSQEDAGKITEADAGDMASGMKLWLDSKEWAEDNQPAKYSRTYKKFSEWVALLSWRGKPAPSEAAKVARRSVERSSAGTDPNKIWVAPWENKEKGEVA
jgi:hypothetical protein